MKGVFSVAHHHRRAKRAAAALAESRDTGQLVFAENPDGSVVHCVAAQADQGRPGDAADRVIDFMLQPWRMVCGVTLWRNRGGLDNGLRRVDGFADDTLCASCHAAFGNDAWRIFHDNPANAWHAVGEPGMGA